MMSSADSGIKQIGVVYNTRVERSLPLAHEIEGWLRSTHDIGVWRCPISTCRESFQPADLLITLGGDGSILRVAQTAAPAGIPILGINLGRVGFLTETPPEHWQDTLAQVLEGRAGVESRMMLCVTLVREGAAIALEHALNEAVVSRGALARTVRLHTAIDGAMMTRYVADGLILATSTGSTAYAYAAGGPILPPWLDNIVLVPTAPHLSFERPVVLDATSVIEVRVETRIPGMLSVDGRMEGELADGDVVRVVRSSIRARFLRLRNRSDFYQTLVNRLIPRNGDPHG